jgi:hypothetical protein
MSDRTFVFTAIVAFVVLLIVLAIVPVYGRDLGQWTGNDPEVSQWYRALMMPDNPKTSCCGEADAYWCDDVHVKPGTDGKPHTFCKITDDRPDEPRKRFHRDIGEEFEIPDFKLKWDQGNPTGHAILFLSTGGIVYCFVLPGGV